LGKYKIKDRKAQNAIIVMKKVIFQENVISKRKIDLIGIMMKIIIGLRGKELMTEGHLE
jgi:hypothetical protein